MYLTTDEEKILKGESGPTKAKCMRLLCSLGDMFGADKLIQIKSSHISGVSYQNIQDPGLEFLENLATEGARSVVPATINPGGIDRQRWLEMGIPDSYAKKQFSVLRAFESMQMLVECTCTPYLAGNRPKFQSHIAWSESSALIFANSVFGARTNRESGISALASAIVGKTPNHGFHLIENRRPTLAVEPDFSLKGDLEFGALGYLIGRQYNNAVPFFKLRSKPTMEGLKALGAGLASAGAIGLFHIENVTPEALEMKKILRGCERMNVAKRDLKTTIEKLSADADWDVVFLGCPQTSIRQLRTIATLLNGKDAQDRLWICTSNAVQKQAEDECTLRAIEKSGGRIFCDTCVEVCPLKHMKIKGIVTDSCKAAHYVPSVSQVKVTLLPTEKCVAAAVNG